MVTSSIVNEVSFSARVDDAVDSEIRRRRGALASCACVSEFEKTVIRLTA